MTTKSDKIYEIVSGEIKACDYQRRLLLEQMEKALQLGNIDSLAVLVSKYQTLTNKIEILKKIMYDIESQITK